MNPHKTAFLWGLRGFFGCVVGYALAFVSSLAGLIVPGYLVLAVALVLPGLFWGVFLGSGRLAAIGAAASGVVTITAFLMTSSNASQWFFNKFTSVLYAQDVAYFRLWLGLVCCLLCLTMGALFGAALLGKASLAAGAGIGARVGVYVSLIVCGATALPGSRALEAVWGTGLLFSAPTLGIGLTLFAAMMGRDKAVQAALEQNT